MYENTIPLQKKIVYGPILSRRLGWSLGVNILSPYQKICSFDCVYCQYGPTQLLSKDPQAHVFYSVAEIEREVEQAVATVKQIDHVTLSGNGEPTLHPKFLEIVQLLRTIIGREKPHARLAIFSNSTNLDNEDVKKGIALTDEPILKMDTAIQGEFLRINHPAEQVHLERVIAQLASSNNPIIQTLFLGGEDGNSGLGSIESWMNALRQIQPKKVYIYSSDYEFSGTRYRRLKPSELIQIEDHTKKSTGMDITAFWR